MSVHVSSWVWQHSITTGDERLLMLALADMANNEGLAWPSTSSLREMCRWKDRTSVQRHLAKCIELGEIEIIPRFRKDGGQTSNEYQFTAFALASERQGRRSEAAGGMATQRHHDPSLDPSLFSLSDKAKPENEQEVITFCRSIGLKQVDGEYFWNHWLSNGFTVGGKPFKNWRAVIRAWTANGHSPSQKPEQKWSTTNGWKNGKVEHKVGSCL